MFLLQEKSAESNIEILSPAFWYDKVSEKLLSWYESAALHLPNLVLAMLIAVVVIVLSKQIKNWFHLFVQKISDNQPINNLLTSTIYAISLVVGGFMVLEVLNLEKTVTSLLASAGIIGLALSFAFQDVATNYISGILLAIRKPFRTGDLVDIGSYKGTIANLSLRETNLRSLQGQEVLIPNKDVLQNKIINYTRTKDRRVDLEVGVSYAENLEEVKKITVDAVKEIKFRDNAYPISFLFHTFGDSSINGTLRFWLNKPEEGYYLEAVDAAIVEIKKAYDNADITIPFPIRTLDFGIKGGERLDEMKMYKKSATDN